MTGHFRLAIDRSFTLAGAGRIVTGAVLSGRVRVGDAVIVSPQGTPARVRSLHAQNRRADAAEAGQRCALNLAGPDLKRAEPARGDWVVAAAAHAPTNRLDVQLQVLAGEARPLTQRGALQLHLGAAAINARVSSLNGAALAPGGEALARLLLDQPVAAVHGDRFILRDAAANRTVAGGWVIDGFGPARGRSRPARLTQLAALALAEPRHSLAALLGQSPDGLDLAAFARNRNLTTDEARQLLDRAEVHAIAGAAGPLGLSIPHWQAWRERVLAALDQWHAEQPDSPGPTEAALHGLLRAPRPAEAGRPLWGSGKVAKPPLLESAPRPAEAGRPPWGSSKVAKPHLLESGAGAGRSRPVLRACLAALAESGEVVREGLRHRRASHRIELCEADQALLAQVLAQLRPAGLRPPIVGELAGALGRPLPTLIEFLERMTRHGLLVRVAPNRWYAPETVAELAAQARALAAESADGSCDAAAFRDRTGIGRNLTIQVLEFLDREGITRFDGVRHRPVA